jgi:hypothetical protein
MTEPPNLHMAAAKLQEVRVLASKKALAKTLPWRNKLHQATKLIKLVLNFYPKNVIEFALLLNGMSEGLGNVEDAV